MITRDIVKMNHGTDILAAAATGFKRWLTIPELKAHVEAERERVGTAPELFAVAYNQRAGYIKVDLSVVKMTSEVNEEGKLIDVELHTISDAFSDAVKIHASVFQPGHGGSLQFCRIFPTARTPTTRTSASSPSCRTTTRWPTST